MSLPLGGVSCWSPRNINTHTSNRSLFFSLQRNRLSHFTVTGFFLNRANLNIAITHSDLYYCYLKQDWNVHKYFRPFGFNLEFITSCFSSAGFFALNSEITAFTTPLLHFLCLYLNFTDVFHLYDCVFIFHCIIKTEFYKQRI